MGFICYCHLDTEDPSLMDTSPRSWQTASWVDQTNATFTMKIASGAAFGQEEPLNGCRRLTWTFWRALRFSKLVIPLLRQWLCATSITALNILSQPGMQTAIYSTAAMTTNSTCRPIFQSDCSGL